MWVNKSILFILIPVIYRSIRERQENSLDRHFWANPIQKLLTKRIGFATGLCVCPVLELVTSLGWIAHTHPVTSGIDSSSHHMTLIRSTLESVGEKTDWIDGYTVSKPIKAFSKDLLLGLCPAYFGFLFKFRERHQQPSTDRWLQTFESWKTRIKLGSILK